MTLRPLDGLHIASGSLINGSFSSLNYIATNYNRTGEQSLLRYDGMGSATVLPVGTLNYYMPVTITPTSNSPQLKPTAMKKALNYLLLMNFPVMPCLNIFSTLLLPQAWGNESLSIFLVYLSIKILGLN